MVCQESMTNLLFHYYTKIEFNAKNLKVNRLKAAGYTYELTEHGFLKKDKISRSNYYIYIALFSILTKECGICSSVLYPFPCNNT